MDGRGGVIHALKTSERVALRGRGGRSAHDHVPPGVWGRGAISNDNFRGEGSNRRLNLEDHNGTGNEGAERAPGLERALRSL